MVSITTFRINRRQVPDGNSKLSVGRNGAVLDGQLKPLVPYSTVLKMLIRSLGVDGERFGVGEGLDSDVELGVRTEIAAAVSKIRPFEESGIWQRLFMAFKAVANQTSAHKRIFM